MSKNAGAWLPLLFALIVQLIPRAAHAEEPWILPGADGQPQIQFYFFWSRTCPHCEAAHPHVTTLSQARPWVRLHEIELSQDQANQRRFAAMVERFGMQAQAGVPAFVFCGEMHVGWDGELVSGTLLAARLDACRARVVAGRSVGAAETAAATQVAIPFVGSIDTGQISLPALTLLLAALDAFNPCAFFVLLFLLSMLAHQNDRSRMLLIGGIFVLVSGLMYFAFMAAWLNVFQLFGHLGWVTLAAGALAVGVGAVNIKDFFWFKRGVSLSIPESGRTDIFRRARAVLAAERLPALLAATIFLAVAANFYELLCTAGFPMVYTRVLTLAELSTAGRYAWLAIYNVIYVLPLAAIVAAFVRTLGARKLSEREGRLLKLLSGLMMIGLGGLLLAAPERLSQAGSAFGLMAAAVAMTWIAARLLR